MLTVRLIRGVSGVDGTFGKLVLPIGMQLVSGELPYRDNKTRVSCIPIGKYKCVWQFSNKFGWCYEVTGVKDRSRILIHAANFCGLASEGFKQELEGCIALGLSLGSNGKQKMLLSSRVAIAKFHEVLNRQPFYLEIGNK